MRSAASLTTGVVYGMRHRVVLLAGLRCRSVGGAMLQTIVELHDLGLVAQLSKATFIRDDGRTTVEDIVVELTEAGVAVAERECATARWLLWRRLYAARRERAARLRAAENIEAAQRMNRRAARALRLARRAFTDAFGVPFDG